MPDPNRPSRPHPTHTCAITGRSLRERDALPLAALGPHLAERLRADHPGLPDDAWLDREVVNRSRHDYIEALLREEHGEVGKLEAEVLRSIERQDTIAADTETEQNNARTLADRLSDGMASFGGSWAFLIVFSAVVAGWILLNLAQGERAFDAYPFILLNLVLSTLAAIQAPVIMMSQNRKDAKDRLRALNDYRVNLKAELEIRALHDKLDHLITRQWQRLAEIQQLQIELLQEKR